VGTIISVLSAQSQKYVTRKLGEKNSKV